LRHGSNAVFCNSAPGDLDILGRITPARLNLYSGYAEAPAALRRQNKVENYRRMFGSN